jgi:HAE1 family hydrophobic/amphiphilic exporter-1
MSLIENFVRSPVKITVGVLLVALFGVVALFRMPMQLTPEVQTPTITVSTRWPGASPQEIEREIIIEQEEQLKSVESLTKLSSESSDSMGTITLEFAVGTDMSRAIVNVIGRLEQVPEYPEDADKPVIATSNASDRPIAWFILSAQQPSHERLEKFGQEHPELREDLRTVEEAINPGLAMLRLRALAKANPAAKELLPPAEMEVTRLRRFAEDEIESLFERVPGVSQANVIGGLEDEMQVIIDPELLAARQLTIDDVRRVLRAQNDDISAGDFWETKRRWVVRTLGRFRSPEQVENQLLAIREGAPVYVRDVAHVQHGYKKPDGLVRRFGESSIALNAMRETGANVLDVMAGLQNVTRDLNKNLLNPRGLVLTQVYDETEYIYSSVDLVQENIFIGGALTMIVLMLFLHLNLRTLLIIPVIIASSYAAAYVSPWFFVITLAVIIGCGFWFARGALVVGLAIPTSIVGTFLVLQMLGRSLNVISLAGLAFAVGMLVDNAVVVLENIYRRYDELGEGPMIASVRGTQEVWGAILASTLTTVAVFLPIVFIQEEAGQLFRDIALAISAAIALSMVVAMTVIPTAAARLFHRRDDEDAGSADQTRDEIRSAPSALRGFFGWCRSAILAPISGSAHGFVVIVAAINAWIQRGTLRRIVATAILVGLSIYGTEMFWPKVEYLPPGNRNLVFGIVLPPPGYNLDQLMEMGETAERELRPYWDIDPAHLTEEQKRSPLIADFFFVARGRQIFLGLRALDPMRVGELIPLIQRIGAKLPGTFVVAKQSSLFEQGLTAGRTIDIEITGPDLTKLVALGGQVFGQVMALDHARIEKQLEEAARIGVHIEPAPSQARPVPSLDLSSPEVHIEPKLVQASQMGVTTSELGYAVNALVDGAYAGDYYLGGDKIDLTIMGREEYSKDIQRVRALPIATPIGQLIPLEALADIEMRSGPEQINHRERSRAITIEVSPPPDVPLEDAMTLIQNEIVTKLRESGQLEGGYRVTLAGTADKLRDTWTALRFNVVLALLITYLLMAALFESWLYPLVVIFSVPLGAVGGVLGLAALNVWLKYTTGNPLAVQSLDVLTMLGFVILIGTVVNNPILIVDQSLNLIRFEGYRPSDAIVESVRTRIRPIFMTTVTTVLGLLPLVLFPGAGSELYRGLGSVVLGGLLISTIFTLVLIPTLFTLTMDAKENFLRLFRRRKENQSGSSTSQDKPAELVGV